MIADKIQSVLGAQYGYKPNPDLLLEWLNALTGATNVGLSAAWQALFDAESIAAGAFQDRMFAWLGTRSATGNTLKDRWDYYWANDFVQFFSETGQTDSNFYTLIDDYYNFTSPAYSGTGVSHYVGYYPYGKSNLYWQQGTYYRPLWADLQTGNLLKVVSATLTLAIAGGSNTQTPWRVYGDANCGTIPSTPSTDSEAMSQPATSGNAEFDIAGLLEEIINDMTAAQLATGYFGIIFRPKAVASINYRSLSTRKYEFEVIAY
jgi:hypothetical protein